LHVSVICLYLANKVLILLLLLILLLKCVEKNYIWSRRLKDTSKNRHWLAFFGPPGIYMCVTSVTLLLCLTVPLLSLFYELLCEDCTSLVANVSPDTVCSRRICAVRVIIYEFFKVVIN